MNEKQEYITDKEISELEDFLLERFDDEEDHPDKDEGILDLSELDGYFAAIVSSPQLTPPSVWLPGMWGDFEPNWKNKKQAEKIMGLLIAIMNSINSDFLDPKNQYQPLFEHREVEDVTYTIVEEWCFGYMRGVALCGQDWDFDNQHLRILLTPIRTFGSYEGLELLNDMTDEEIGNIKKNIVPNVLEIFQFWRNNNANVAPAHSASSHLSTETFVRGVVKVGRNDPCSCGSGKKFKKCCLH